MFMIRKPATSIRPIVFHALLIAVCLAAAGPLFAQEDSGEAPKPAKLFDSEDALTVKLSAPWRDIVRKRKVQDPYPATIEYTDELGNQVSLPLTVERRGVKRQEACKFPPIKLRFEKEVVKGTTFRGQKSIKMVTHCDVGSDYEQYYVVEMLIYRMYNLLTDFSFRVRPLTITYYDSERDKAEDPMFAFLIEDDSDLAKRMGMEKLEVPQVHYKRLEPNLTSVFSLFQYMIGNVDWSALRGPDPEECCHNVKLIAPEGAGDSDWIYPIAYDFDSSGLVDAEYAAPPEGVPIRRVTDRIFRGYCWHNGTLDEARDLYLQNESAILGVIDNEARLTAKTKKIADDFLEDFFKTLRDPQGFEKEVVSDCRGKSQ